MNKNEIILSHKLGMIYDELLDIRWKLEKLELDKRKKKAEESKRFSERELEEVHYQENDFWNFKEKRIKEFNYRFDEMIEKETI